MFFFFFTLTKTWTANLKIAVEFKNIYSAFYSLGDEYLIINVSIIRINNVSLQSINTYVII